MRREGLFTLIHLVQTTYDEYGSRGNGIGDPDAFQTSYFDLEEDWRSDPVHPGYSRFGSERFPGRSEIYDLLLDATCGIYVTSDFAGWNDEDDHVLARLRHTGTPMKIVICVMHDAPGHETLIQTVRQRTGMCPEMVHLEMSDTSEVQAAGTELSQLVRWMAAQNRSIACRLAQDLPAFRNMIASGELRTSALATAVLGAAPAPLIDIPLLLLVQYRMATRIATMYGYPAPDLFQGEGASVVTVGLCTRYAAQQIAKFVPFVGWLLSALLSGCSTWLLGNGLIRRYERRPIVTLRSGYDLLRNTKASFARGIRGVPGAWCVFERSTSHNGYKSPTSSTMNGGSPCNGENGCEAL